MTDNFLTFEQNSYHSAIFVILSCFHFTNFFGEEKFRWLPSKNKVADEKTEKEFDECAFRQMKEGQSSKYNTSTTVGFVQVWMSFDRNISDLDL